MPAFPHPHDSLVAASVAVTCALLRFSADLVADASAAAQKSEERESVAGGDDGGDDDADAPRSARATRRFLCDCLRFRRAAGGGGGQEGGREESEGAASSLLPAKAKATAPGGREAEDATYGAIQEVRADVENQKDGRGDGKPPGARAVLPAVSLVAHLVLFTYFLAAAAMSSSGAVPLGCAAAAAFLGIVLNLRDYERKRFGTFQRVMYTSSTIIFLFGYLAVHVGAVVGGRATSANLVTLAVFLLYALLAVGECRLAPYPAHDTKAGRKARLTTTALLQILKPYFWPHATADSATLNRLRAVATYLCVILSKACTIAAPLFLGRASTELTRLRYGEAIRHSVYFVVLKLLGSAFKECQGLLYLFVAQAAFVELSEVTFSHLHNLSLDWHLRKKLGETIRSMDRGIGACDSLMRYGFLFLLPAVGEMVAVVIVFASYFDYAPLAVTTFAFVFVYALLTILLTLWRKKFRNRVTKSDNDWHDICTDSLINFETVKYFTSEEYEIKRFVKSIGRFQQGSVNVKASLSYLNISQQVLMQACLATCLSLAVVSIRNRIDCCLSFGCDLGNSECCSTSEHCTGLEMGDFIAVLTYTLNLFAPLNYLGSIYNSMVMSLVDLANLSELLVENPDVVDAPGAVDVPPSNRDGSDVVVEFDDVRFHYPTQPNTKGLKNLSFKLLKGKTTAVVGTTGEGKTTVSRLLFRFYDVLAGSIRINGEDVRSLKQTSLRGTIGVVPQNACLFNDTLKNNIKYGRHNATDEEITQVIEDAQLKSFIDSLPEGWDTVVGDRGLKLSGGEKQRTAIARCLLKNPPIVVLDEATSALDTLTENSIQEALDRLGNDRTVLVIAHRLGTIKGADNIIVLGDGTVAEEGTHDDLLALGGRYAEMWNMQLNSTRGNRSAGSLTSMSQLES